MTPSTRPKLISRIDNILNYRKHHTLEETGAKFGITAERVRQIQFTKHRKKCKVHNRFYYNKCSYCLGTQYKTLLRWADWRFIENEVKREAENRSRDYLSVQRRIYLIEVLYERYNKSFTQISIMLKRDRSTIVHLYANYIKNE